MDININELKDSNEFLKVLMENLSSAIFIVDQNLRIRNFNDSFRALFHKTEDRILGELCGNALGCVFTVDENKECGTTTNCRKCLLRNALIKSFTEKIPAYKELLERVFVVDGKKILKYFQYTTKYVRFNKKEMVLIIVDDITELETSYQRMKEMAITDGLTGLYNHNHIFRKLEEEIDKSKRYGNPLSLIMLDIDFFKSINDNHGH